MKTYTTKSGYEILQLLSERSNVFMLRNKLTNILIDTNTSRRRDLLIHRLSELGTDRIDYLILTHAHFDHAGNASWLKQNYGARIIVHRLEVPVLLSGLNKPPGGTNFITSFLVWVASKIFRITARFTPCQADIAVDNFLDLKELGFNAFVMHTPGHTAGSVSVIIDNEIAIVGDTMFGIFRHTVFPPFADDAKQLIRSWNALLNTSCKIFIPSHGRANDRELVMKDYERRK
jgi:glyoxylase-like metal-dependent hydrolase (beta-lactamase superfamily II)